MLAKLTRTNQVPPPPPFINSENQSSETEFSILIRAVGYLTSKYTCSNSMSEIPSPYSLHFRLITDHSSNSPSVRRQYAPLLSLTKQYQFPLFSTDGLFLSCNSHKGSVEQSSMSCFSRTMLILLL